MITAVSSTEESNKDLPVSAWGGRDGKTRSRLSGANRRRSVPHALIGVVLVAVCSVAGVLGGMHLGDRESVLTLARSVAVGQALSRWDLEQVSMAADSGMELIPASAASTVVGRPVAFSLPAGSLLVRSMLGPARVLAQGKVIAAVGLKPGQFPPDLVPGTTVLVLAPPQQGQNSVWPAVVTGIASRDTELTTVLSLELTRSDARGLAASSMERLSVVAAPEGDR
jgi:hypothetical protein